MSKTVCIVTLGRVARMARVLRQIEYLVPHYNVTVIGEGERLPDWESHPKVKWLPLGETRRGWRNNVRSGALLLAGMGLPSAFERWWAGHPVYSKLPGAIAAAGHFDALHANSWETLPAAVAAAERTGAKLVLHSPEDIPERSSGDYFINRRLAQAADFFLKKYAGRVDAATTVAPLIAKRYEQVYGLRSEVVMNAPALIPLPEKATDPQDVRLIYHGHDSPDRKLEKMIETVALCPPRFSLHFMLIAENASYTAFLKEEAQKTAPGRVFFHPAVPPTQITRQVGQFDIGVCVYEPNTSNLELCLPNKFFEFVVGGLAVCIGPSPSMTEIASRYGFGCLVPSCEPRDVAAALAALTPERLAEMKAAARRAAEDLHAGAQMAKVVEIYRRLIGN